MTREPPSNFQRSLIAAILLWLAAVLPARATLLPTGQEPAVKPEVPVFEFHSGFWINLHHFLYQQARARGTQSSPPSGETPVSTEALTQDERSAWAAGLAYYSGGFADRDLLFNGDMVLINNRLAELEACVDLSGRAVSACSSGLRPELIAALESAAPVYRARWWPQQDRANRAWIGALEPLVRQYGVKLSQQLAETYESNWPSGILRVDVVNYGGPYGAYTTLDPAHLTISGTDPRNQGLAALEVLFHEASHTLAGAVRDAIARECRQRGKPIPRDLWHALLFYTTGEIVKRALSKVPAGQAGPGAYTPYAFRNKLYERGWTSYERALELYWQPYLDGKAEFGSAVARLVSAL
jgi:hypothetical protein